MKTSDAVLHFGSHAALARALDMKSQSIYDWGDSPPKLRQLQIEAVTKRALRADKDCLPRRRRASPKPAQPIAAAA